MIYVGAGQRAHQDAAEHGGSIRQLTVGAQEGPAVEVIHLMRRGFMMDGTLECHTHSERLSVRSAMPKWRKQMTWVELGSLFFFFLKALPGVDGI